MASTLRDLVVASCTPYSSNSDKTHRASYFCMRAKSLQFHSENLYLISQWGASNALSLISAAEALTSISIPFFLYFFVAMEFVFVCVFGDDDIHHQMIATPLAGGKSFWHMNGKSGRLVKWLQKDKNTKYIFMCIPTYTHTCTHTIKQTKKTFVIAGLDNWMYQWSIKKLPFKTAQKVLFLSILFVHISPSIHSMVSFSRRLWKILFINPPQQ